MRYERKYRIDNLPFSEVESKVRNHSLAFLPAFPDRWVNTLYLDNKELDCLRENLESTRNRVQFRIRWYGADMLEVKAPVLESKIISGYLEEKSHRPLPSFHIHSRHTIADYVKLHLTSTLDAEPVLLSRYLRSYYQSAGGDYRLTIDRAIEFRSVSPGFFSVLNHTADPAVIVEVKYAEGMDESWTWNEPYWPFSETRFSKYVQGMLTY
jgi:VTC domain